MIYTSPPLSSHQRRKVLDLIEEWQKQLDATRTLFALSLVMLETGIFDERIEKFLSLAEKKQDRNPDSPTYGNLTYYLDSDKIVDLNSVEFCMRDGLLIWIRHRDRLSLKVKEILKRLLSYGIEGIKRHNVKVYYTNIFLLKTWNLIGSGESFGQQDIAEEGYKQLDNWIEWTEKNGIREYSSPNYYHVDITGLGLIYNYTKNTEAKKDAEKCLKLFWTDLGANFFRAAGRIGGPRSRDYDYIYGKNGVDSLLKYYNWIKKENGYIPDYLVALSEWKPPESIKRLNRTYPRFIERKIAPPEGEWACHYTGRKISIGCHSFAYSPLDKVLAFFFADEKIPNGYVVFDGRNDPYGKKPEKNPWSGNEHRVHLHLVPFITAYQNKNEIVMYSMMKASDPTLPRIAPNLSGFYTHFVFPKAEVYIDGKKVRFSKGEKISLRINEPVVIKRGSVAVGIKIFHASNMQKVEPQMFLVDDGLYGVARITVVHSDTKVDDGKADIGFYMVAAENVKNAEIFSERVKRKRFHLVYQSDTVEIVERSKKMKTVLRFNPEKGEKIVQKKIDAVLSINGKDIGRKILEKGG